MHRRKISNPYEVVIDFSSSNTESISANKSFGKTSFASNEDDQENSTPGTIYKSSDQILLKTETNIECKPVKKRPQGGKKQWLTLEQKQARMAQNELAKLQAAEKKKLEKEIKKGDVSGKKTLDKEAKKI